MKGGWGSRIVAALAAVGLLLAASVAVAANRPAMVTVGDLTVTANAVVSPSALPKRARTPAGVRVEGKIATTDGTHIPAAETFVVEGDRNVAVTVKGYPVCQPGLLQSIGTRGAMNACPAALLGQGRATAELSFPGTPPILTSSKLLIFNGGERGGVVTLLIHAFITVPTPAAIVTVVKIQRVGKGRYGTISTASIPKIAGGAGSVRSFALTLDKKWKHKGRKIGVISARCPSGQLQANVTAIFSGGLTTEGTIAHGCTGRDQK